MTQVIILAILSHGFIFVSGYAFGSLVQIRKNLVVLYSIQTEAASLFDRYKVWANEAMSALAKAEAK